jgi:hypothetical protein
MLTVYLGVRLLYRERSMLNALGAAWLGLMVADPKAFLGPSFQLTFLAVFIVAALAIPLLEKTSQPYLRAAPGVDGLRPDCGATSRADAAGPSHDRGTANAISGTACVGGFALGHGASDVERF